MSRNSFPFEIIAAAPIALFTAPVGTAFPTLDTAEADFDAAWKKIGISGDLNYDDGSGVKVTHPQATAPWRALGEAGARKIFRTDEDCKVAVKVVDITLETYGLAINYNAPSTTPAGVGTAGFKKLGLSRGLVVNNKALLIRLLVSPYGDLWIGQYEFPVAAQTGSPSVEYMKGKPVGLDLEFTALVDQNASAEDERFGRLIFQDADATS